MGQPDRSGGRSVRRVSDALERRWRRGTPLDHLRDAWTWLLVDASRSLVVALLAAGVYVATVSVGVFGPWSQQQYLLGGTSIANAYIELQPGVLTVMTIVLTINQLVLAPEIGPVSRQRERLEGVLAHRVEVENVAGTTPSTEPARFLGALAGATRSRAERLAGAVADEADPALRRDVEEYAADVVEEADRIREALEDQRFGRIGMVGAAMHYDVARDVHRLRELREEYDGALSPAERKAFDDVADVLELYAISRQYFQTLYVRSEFVRFSRAILYTGVPALLVAHYAVGAVGPDVVPGATFGVRNLLWLEAGTFTLALLPVAVLVSYVARLVTLAETSTFVGPFTPGREDGDRRPGDERG